jgi:pimeloyl-ACP methyl ester carboxylesterase
VPLERQKLNAWHATLAVEQRGPTEGAASTVMVLHSEEGPESVTPIVAGLAEHSRVVVPHHPGFGGEARVPGADRPRDLAYLYLDLLDRLEVDECAIVASSLGAWIGLEMAAMHPRRFRSLVLVSPVGVKFAGRMERTFGELLVGPPGSIAEMLYHDLAHDPWRDRTDPEDVVRRMEQRESFMHYVWEPYLHDPNLRQLLPRINPPVLIVAGTSDAAVTEGYYETFAGALSAAEVVRVDEAGHYPEIEQPARTTELAVQFIAKYWDQAHGLTRRDGNQ